MPPSRDPKLPDYKYAPLKNSNCLRLLRLRPASDEQEDIDCEIVELPLLEDADSGDASSNTPSGQIEPGKENGSSEEHHHMNGVLDNQVLPEQFDSSDDEGNAASRGLLNRGKEESNPDEHLGVHVNKRYSYEAVSWCWGREPADKILRIHNDDIVYAFHVSRNLRSALWALRKTNEVRQLWIDAICIDQKNTKERNQQVPRMDKIYGKATRVCIWLGDGDDDSKLAMEFIRQKVLKLWEFDVLIENREMARQWAALIRLMKRPWFSRRWVVQEIALSPRGGTLYCGKEQNSWQDFADAVSLFVEVESATHRLSDVMKLDQSFGNIPDFFGDVSSLGAALLVDATSNLFRNAMTGERRPLSSLEFLVSRLSVFEATQPRDTIYALLAISKDTMPQNLSNNSAFPGNSSSEKTAMTLAPAKGFVIQPYNVDYKLPVIDVYQEFIAFSVRKSDPTRALDIICRPWAPTVVESHDAPEFQSNPIRNGKRKGKGEDREIPLPSWIPSLSGAAFEMEEHPALGLRMERQNADPLVGMPDYGHRNYSAAGTRTVDHQKLKFEKWDTLRKEGASYPEYSMFVQGFILDEVSTLEQIASNGNLPYRWLRAGGWTDVGENPPDKFWRTLVADRAHGGRNPPTYFPRACKESLKFFKSKTTSKTSGNLDTRKLINEGRCTIVAEFLRRMQEVIWNRQLMKTKDGRLGLVREDVCPGFKVCILYGCSVPIILQQIAKSPKESKAEQRDRYKKWRKELDRVVAICQARYRIKRLRKALEAQKSQMSSLEVKQPKTREESLEWLSRPRKGSWPLTANEMLETTAMVPLAIGTSLNVTPIGSDTQRTNGALNSSPTPNVEIQPPGDEQSQDEAVTPSAEDIVREVSESIIPPAPGSLQGKQSTESIQSEQELKEKQRSTTYQENADLPSEVRRKTTQQERSEGEKLFQERKMRERNRPITQSPYYRLVGECYVHGIMNGEAIGIQNRHRKDIPEQTFELR